MSFLFHWFLFGVAGILFVFSFPHVMTSAFLTNATATAHVHLLRMHFSLHLSLSPNAFHSSYELNFFFDAHTSPKLFTWINEGNKYLFSLNEIYWSVSFMHGFCFVCIVFLFSLRFYPSFNENHLLFSGDYQLVKIHLKFSAESYFKLC